MFEDWTNCRVCEYNPTGDKCELFGRVIGMHGCSSGVERKPRNNFEMVKAMSMEQMAVVFAFHYIAPPPWCAEHKTFPYISEDPTPCDKCALEWLKEEVDG